MVMTRASLGRAQHNDGTMNAAAAAQQQQQHIKVIDLTASCDEVEVPELPQPNAKRQKKNSDQLSENLSRSRSRRALKPVNPNDSRINSTTTTSTISDRMDDVRTTRSRNSAVVSKPAAAAPPARVVSENPSTKRTKVTRTATTSNNDATTNNNKKRKAAPRPSNPYSFRQKKGVPIKTPATTESISSGDNHGTSTHKPQRRSNSIADSTVSSLAAVSSKKRPSSDAAKNITTKRYQYDGNADDIDARDQDNPQSVTDYVKDIYDYYRQREEFTTVLTPLSTERQPHITERMRAILVDWILEVHYKFKLCQQTLYLAISILDRFLHKSNKPVSRRELQLVGITSLLVAAKYEELFVPELRDLAYICDGAYTESQILETEERILKDIEYNLTVPTAHCFLVRYLKAAHADRTMVHISSMILDSTLISFERLTCRFLPSQLAAGAIMAARRTVGRYDWSPTLLQYSQYCEEDVKPVAKAILQAKDSIHSDLVALQKKYSKNKYGKVSEVELASMEEEVCDDYHYDDESYED
ncbi:cyclin-like protein [Nitzschia inconspicua]|uniref:Cyclin-like protein n=1 Tax=Nitzschia inconspicua TaxID=303405 RepID=A0A9K3KBE9_9STRA|nr:cyclin-like protein [Nitzschia inconspicua]